MDAVERCDEIEGLAVPHNQETQKTVMFVNAACDSLSIRGANRAKPEEHVSDVADVVDIQTYFARPRLITRVDFSPGTSLPVLWSLDLNNANIKSTMSVNFTRAAGAFGYRGTMCFRAQVVATPFMAGRLRFAFEPVNTSAIYPAGLGRVDNICPLSQLPGVELDLNDSTDMVIKVPFLHALSYFSVSESNSTEMLGRISLVKYQPLTVATGVGAPAIAIWGWIEDFETIGAAASVVSFQMGKLTPSSKEAKVIPGNLSNVLSAGANLIMWAGSRIPTISAFAGPTTWVLRQASHVAASYGWAKPVDASAAHKIITTDMTYQHNYDGIDTSHVLGGFAENAIVPSVGFAGSDMDEMAFDFLKQVSCAISQTSLLTTDTAGELIYACNLNPMAMLYYPGTRNVTAVPDAFLRAPLWASTVFGLANCFTNFRGGFKFKVKIAKTRFHTGKLLLGFNPTLFVTNTSSGNKLPDDYFSGLFKSVIWDLRESSEMEFEAPYICAAPYLSVELPYGAFFISVLEPLVAPDTVATSVPLLVEVAGMPDLEFSVPRPKTYGLCPSTEPPSLLVSNVLEQEKTDVGTITFQSGDFTPYRGVIPEMAHLCVGEKINSVKQLISRADLVRVPVTAVETYNNAPSLPTWNIGGNSQPDNSMLNYFQYWYGFFRGGYCYDFISFGDKGRLTALPTSLNDAVTNLPVIRENDGHLHVKVPYYNRYTKSMLGSNWSNSSYVLKVLFSGERTTPAYAAFMRAADDYQYGYFIGCPKLTRYHPDELSTTFIAQATLNDVPPV